MEEFSFDSFTRRIYITAPLEKLYRCWASETGLTDWFLQDAKFQRSGEIISKNDLVRAGDSYIWKWHNWDGKETGKILEASGTDSLVFSFAGECRVTITLEDREDAVLVSLHQSNIPTDDDNKLKIHFGCSNGWTFWLANLKAYLEHGIKLNETNFDLTHNKFAGFEYVNI